MNFEQQLKIAQKDLRFRLDNGLLLADEKKRLEKLALNYNEIKGLR